ncbi:GNAT family N-acetyltransferase [Deinococcus navajonensis]|uniref:GNAT family N-acetyltransferase n=1 Tax=Deinococcus navajonensis TaxID=309884 RepID=A0ABV8XQU5_9DEIO
MSLEVRPIREAEWAAAGRVYTAALPHDPISGPELRKRQEEQQDWGYKAGVLVVVDAQGTVIGTASYFQNPGAYHPGRFTLELAVDPSAQGQGSGAALWRALEARLRQEGAEAARVLAREDHPVAPDFLRCRGFVGDKRYFTSALEVAGFDEAPYQGLLERLAQQGIQIRSLADLRGVGLPELETRLHALMNDVRADVPRAEPATPLSFQVFKEAVLGDPGLLPTAYLVAEHQGQFVGQTVLFRSEASGDLMTGLTGVTRAWRGQGVATALKVRAILAARELGATLIRTDNASDNAPMLAINDRLGFVRNPASVSYMLQF